MLKFDQDKNFKWFNMVIIFAVFVYLYIRYVMSIYVSFIQRGKK
jgi:hypothetical protein